MKTSDITLTILIIFIFIALAAFNFIAIGINNVKKNWPKYRCNPSVMPFSSLFGQDPMENFTYCIQNMQSNFMNYLLEPVHHSLANVSSLGSGFNDAIQNIRKLFSSVRNFVTSIIQNIFGVFLNILIEFQRITISFKDTMAKNIGILASLFFLMDGTVKTMESAWAGPAGQMTRALCFHPDTLLQLYNGKFVKMKNIELGDKLKNGNSVVATLRINNLDENGKCKENFYMFNNGENKSPILVTGKHLIKISEYYEKYDYVKNHPDAIKTEITHDTLSCLVTSNNKINIGKYTFWDWEDTPEMRMGLK